MDNKMTAAVFMADGFEEIEAVTVIDILRRAEINTQTVSIMEKLTVTGAHDVVITCDCMFKDMDDAEILILPGGGVGTQNLKNHEGLGKKLLEFNKDNKWIGAICAAPTVLGSLGILEDKKAVCYPSCEPDLKAAETGKTDVLVCDNIITSRGPATAAEFGLKITELLKDKKTAETVAEQMLYQRL